MAHPPRSNPLLRSSSVAPPFPCITPSTVTCVMVVSFMGSSFRSWWSLVFLVGCTLQQGGACGDEDAVPVRLREVDGAVDLEGIAAAGRVAGGGAAGGAGGG